MKEHPIIFRGDMIRAILDGRKTQTRRVIKPQPANMNDERRRALVLSGCPYGEIGDRLWVKETFVWQYTGFDYKIVYKADGIKINEAMKWSPSIYMRKQDSRITLEIINIRVERIQDITGEDAIAEGCEVGHELTDNSPFLARIVFRQLWDSINKKRGYGWEVDPYVWVIEFKKI